MQNDLLSIPDDLNVSKSTGAIRPLTPVLTTSLQYVNLEILIKTGVRVQNWTIKNLDSRSMICKVKTLTSNRNRNKLVHADVFDKNKAVASD